MDPRDEGDASSSAPRRRGVLARVCALGLGLALVWVAALWATTPSVARTCERVLELATWAGEGADPQARAVCEARYAAQRERAGWLRWRRRARCTLRARSIPEAGACTGLE